MGVGLGGCSGPLANTAERDINDTEGSDGHSADPQAFTQTAFNTGINNGKLWLNRLLNEPPGGFLHVFMAWDVGGGTVLTDVIWTTCYVWRREPWSRDALKPWRTNQPLETFPSCSPRNQWNGYSSSSTPNKLLSLLLFLLTLLIPLSSLSLLLLYCSGHRRDWNAEPVKLGPPARWTWCTGVSRTAPERTDGIRRNSVECWQLTFRENRERVCRTFNEPVDSSATKMQKENVWWSCTFIFTLLVTSHVVFTEAHYALSHRSTQRGTWLYSLKTGTQFVLQG